MLEQQGHQVVTLTTLHRAAIVREGAQHHRHCEAFHGVTQRLGDLLAARHQHRLEPQHRLELPRDRIRRARPHVGQIQAPCGQGPRLLDPPASLRPLTDLAGRQPWGSAPMGQRALPGTLPPHRDQPPWRRAGMRALRAPGKACVPIVGATAQHRHGARRRFSRLRVTQNFGAAVPSSPHRKLQPPRSNTTKPPTGSAARIPAAHRWSLAATSSVERCPRGRWLQAATRTRVLPARLTPSRARKTWVR